MNEQIRINWYRPAVAPATMKQLLQKSDRLGFAQVVPQLLLFAATGTLAFVAFKNVKSDNLAWSLPVLLAALFIHGTFSTFISSGCHELCHKTPFKTQRWNTLFYNLYSFLVWFDPVAYRASHSKHHQATVHHDHDGEVVLPQGLDWYGVRFVLGQLIWNPLHTWNILRHNINVARGAGSSDAFLKAEWVDRILPETNLELRKEHRQWSLVLLLGHLALATLFILTGNWFLIIIVSFCTHYSQWLQLLAGAPQHVGLMSDATDFRLCTRTFTCSRFLGFLYWNMQYHAEHHMYPAVPFYNLPALREAIKHEMPPATHGLWATWKEMLPILKRQRKEKDYYYVPLIPTPTSGVSAPRQAADA